jgi:hypothetical protein
MREWVFKHIKHKELKGNQDRMGVRERSQQVEGEKRKGGKSLTD